jgi:hypothetical protein
LVSNWCSALGRELEFYFQGQIQTSQASVKQISRITH